MSDLYEKIVNQRSTFESITAKIPGFSGYMERSARREADRMLRDHIAGVLAQCIKRLSDIEKKLLDKGGLSYMSKTRSAKSKMQTFHDRVKTATPGHSGFFEKIKVGPEELEKIYSFDEAQLRYADQFNDALDVLADAVSKNENIDTAISELDRIAAEANEAFFLRAGILTDLSMSS